jgi:hypothetical protein
MSWMSAAMRASLIVVYFAVATVVLPHVVLRIDGVARASASYQQLIATIVWAVGLGVGMWMLRRSQRRGLI